MLILALFFGGACLMLLSGTLVFLIFRPEPDGWLRKPRWHGLSALQCGAAPVVLIAVVGLPIFWLAGVEGKSPYVFAGTVSVVLLVVIMFGSYAAFLLTGRKHDAFLWVAAAALAALLVIAFFVSNNRVAPHRR
jgi:hypothetical protein